MKSLTVVRSVGSQTAQSLGLRKRGGVQDPLRTPPKIGLAPAGRDPGTPVEWQSSDPTTPTVGSVDIAELKSRPALPRPVGMRPLDLTKVLDLKPQLLTGAT